MEKIVLIVEDKKKTAVNFFRFGFLSTVKRKGEIKGVFSQGDQFTFAEPNSFDTKLE